MRDYIILILSFLILLFFYAHLLAKEKHMTQIDSTGSSQVEIRDMYYKQLKHLKTELDKTVKKCLETIIHAPFISDNTKKEWKNAFLKSQADWEELIKSDTQVIEYVYYRGSGTEIFKLEFQVDKTAERIKELQKRFYLN